MGDSKVLLVGDNPFQGVSHFTQERAVARGKAPTEPSHAARVVLASVGSGADGFMFTTSPGTLAILRAIDCADPRIPLRLYALVPNASEFVRSAAMAGGVRGLTVGLAREIVRSVNVSAVINGVRGVVANDPAALLRCLLSYEVSRIRSAMGHGSVLASVMLHELVTDMALALDLEWVFRTHVGHVRKMGASPGFETRNFAHLVSALDRWGIGLDGVVIAAPFNPIGFQMCPSRTRCEQALSTASRAEVVGFSILAAGRLGLPEAIAYVSGLGELKGVAVGASTVEQASETFGILSRSFGR